MDEITRLTWNWDNGKIILDKILSRFQENSCELLTQTVWNLRTVVAFMSLLCLSMCLIHTNLPASTTTHPPRHPCLLFPILIFHTRSVMHLDYIAVIIDSGQVAYLTGFFIKLCRKMFGSYQSAGILKFRFYQHLQFPMPKKAETCFILNKRRSRDDTSRQN